MTNIDDEANEKYSEKVLTTGTWIDAAFLEDVLRLSEKDEVKVADHNVTAAVGVGDNFLSILYKTSVTYTTGSSDEPQQKFLMIKGVPTAKVLLEMIDEMGIFVKEIAMYSETLPALQQYIKQYFKPGTEHVAPEGYQCSRPDTLVMEDIGEAGYKMANRRNQLDLDHCLATMRTLARFHAASVKLQKDDPDLIARVSKDFYNEDNREKMAMFLEGTFSVLTGAIEKWGEHTQYIPHIKDISRFVWDKLMHIVKPTDGFNVLNHGDLWVNNMLFKYDKEGLVSNVKLVDFQLSRYTTPACDLLYFFFTSPQPQVLSAHMDEIIAAYHEALMADLATLGIHVDFSVEQLHEDLRDRATFGVISMAQILPIIMAPPSEVLDLDSIENFEDIKLDPDDHPMLKNYMNSGYRNVAGKLLHFMESRGYLAAAVERMQHVVDAAEAREASAKLNEVEKES